jgi:hypothetical protein
MEEIKNNPWIETVSGKHFHFLSPSPDEIDIHDIAYALSNLCRYTGHCSSFYSVAEHSVYVASLLPSELRLAGLLHDAAEAYLGDVNSPLKRLLPDYKKIEKRVEEAIANKFKLPFPHPTGIKHADLQQLRTESFHLIPSKGAEWGLDKLLVENGRAPKCVPPAAAYRVFMAVYESITKPIIELPPEKKIIL